MIGKIVLIGTTSSMMIQFRQDLIKVLHANGWMIYTFICEYSSDDLEHLKELGAIPVTYKMSRGGLNPLADIRAMFQLKKKISQIQPQIVFSCFAKPIVYGTLAAKMAKVPYVVGMLEGLGHAFTEQPEGQSLKTKLIKTVQILLYKVALPKLDQIIFLNPDDPKDLLETYHIKTKKKDILGGIGLDLNHYTYSQPIIDPINFLFIGRLLKEKGIFDFIQAARIVKSQYSNVKFTVLGSIDPHNQGALSQEQLDALLNEKLFEYPGYVSNIQDWIHQSSVFVLPSYREGVPRSTQEAMAIGRPVITTDVPGCRETVINGVNGFLVPKWNPEALAEKMLYFIEHPVKINEMGQASRKMAEEKFDAKKVNAKLCKLLGIESIH
ncbi:glycosyltransferase family 1 protein [Wohlfahrtiimonas chitiniclastica]|uniref:glycosyltransferase family 4 protein n=1 Tax=Wohlfahrtiimonas chitiniclastica TaxID=400946 RepID=UPI000B9986BB|nr:glycosyltransferase family 4 protein [Wohlfahrtiimonas chitiniclastica]MBS7814906.1 glycosyltransferase family 4 protein [Wohlfahrtiimonas chitiniclastica]MBS7826697.1 glycosyltransferase family 4 protein [Wohlfahrtiimonas chitiniclastica]OYQ82223.1 glycosyltransferase family 1 protein [Wohlfahrtiimonas chitiniclastica]OYQ83702.1 glycosyltransferase family 1 protein [Wohlfahrtiimonas chitiniclastica]OYQ84537.1 glycosyltransferase family 1 protein [Wohlfahrtiimonas chitiniclastica]